MSLIGRHLEEACQTLATSNDEVIQAAGLAGQLRLNALQKRMRGEKTTSLLLTSTWDRYHPLVKEVVHDMHIAENSGQWPLSTYGPYRCHPSLPDVQDHSFEEMRHQYYEAAKAGNVVRFQKKWQTLLESALTKMKALQSPSAKIVEILQEMHDRT